ncbi:hypothetical protein ES705_05043 [subsurface metagenome]
MLVRGLKYKVPGRQDETILAHPSYAILAQKGDTAIKPNTSVAI